MRKHRKVFGDMLRVLCAALLALVVIPVSSSFAAPQDGAEDADRTVRIGYYQGDPRFQDGFSDNARKSGYAYDYYQEIAPYAGWVYDYAYGTREEMMNALLNGEVDIVAGVYDTDDLAGAALLSSDDMGLEGDRRYFAVSAQRPELLAQLNSAISDIHAQSPKFEVETWQKYYGASSTVQELTDEERQWLAEKGSLKVAYMLDNLPISGRDDDGNPSGVVAELFKAMQDYMGIPIEPIGFQTSDQSREALAAQSVDMVLPTYSDPWLSESRGIYQSVPFISDRVIVVFKEDSPHLLTKVAINEGGLGQPNFIRTHYPNAEMVFCVSREETFKAVEDGKATCALGPASIITRYIAEHPSYDGYQTAYLEGTEYYAIGSRQNEPILAQIINKFVLQIDNALMNNALITYSYVTPDYSFTEVIKKYSLLIILFFTAVLLVLVYVFYAYRKRVDKFNLEQAETRGALEDALAVASNASEAKTTFLSSMSHDIRTPMNGIIGMTAIAAANIDDKSRVEDCLAKIASSGKHLLALINEILDVSKIESGKFELVEESFSLSDMVDDLITMNMPMADAKDLKMTMRVENVEHELVEGDRTRLQQVFTNLVGNAIKYTPEGGSVDIKLVERPSGSPTIGRYDFIVKDSGIGISEEFLPELFNAFARANDMQAVKEQGTGLGLPIALSIARMMNGDITVESEPGKGSTFTTTVFLKLANVEDASYEDFIDLSVLVVDDDKDACEYTCTLLDSLGMNGDFALSGREAVRMVKERYEADDSYFAVILDWIMPDMDGIETLRAIRASVPENIPIIIVSAYDWSEIESEAREAGVEYFVSKPLFKSRIAQLFGKLVGSPEEDDLNDLSEIAEELPLAGKRALLAEDNDLNAEIAISLLGIAGMEIERAENGKETVEMVQASEPGHYDCIFMDIQMPVMDGLEAARVIRDMDRADAKTIPIFAMTANAFVDDVKESESVGMNEHFAKPLDFEKIVTVVSKYLS